MSTPRIDDGRTNLAFEAASGPAVSSPAFTTLASPVSLAAVNDDYTKDLSKKLVIWLAASKFWSAIHWLVGTASVALSALSAVQVLREPYQSIVAVSTTITIGFLGFANPQRLANRHVRAYVILDPALRDYRMGLLDAKTLTQIHRQAEATLHGTGDNPTPTSS